MNLCGTIFLFSSRTINRQAHGLVLSFSHSLTKTFMFKAYLVHDNVDIYNDQCHAEKLSEMKILYIIYAWEAERQEEIDNELKEEVEAADLNLMNFVLQLLSAKQMIYELNEHFFVMNKSCFVISLVLACLFNLVFGCLFVSKSF